MVKTTPVRWKIHLLVPHSGIKTRGIRRFVQARGISSTDMDAFIDKERDIGARRFAEAVQGRLLADPASQISEVEVYFFDIARQICDVGRLWGATPSVETEYLNTFALPAEIAGFSLSGIPQEIIGQLGVEYQSFVSKVAAGIAAPYLNHLLVEFHSFNFQDGNGVVRPDAAFVFTDQFGVEHGLVDPAYTRVGISAEHQTDTCDLSVIGVFDREIRSTFPSILLNHNAPPYNLPQGNISLRLANWQRLHRMHAMDPRFFWRFPLFTVGEDRVVGGVDLAERDVLPSARQRFEAFAIEIRKDHITDPTYLNGFADAIARSIQNVALSPD